jgi:hypothetical protein
MQHIKTDRFGNPYILKGAKENDNGYAKGVFFEIGGKTVKIEVSEASKDGVKYWVKATTVKKHKKVTSL